MYGKLDLINYIYIYIHICIYIYIWYFLFGKFVYGQLYVVNYIVVCTGLLGSMVCRALGRMLATLI